MTPASAEVVLLDDLRTALTAGARDVFDINRHVQNASIARGANGYQNHEVIHGLGHLTRAGEIDCTASESPSRWLYQPRLLHTRTADCVCGPIVTAPGVHQHHGPEPRVFIAVAGDDVAPDGTPTDFHQ